jgi:hypothetical protein
MSIACMSEDDREAVFILTNLATGDSLNMCGECAPAAFRTLADSLAPVEAPPVEAEADAKPKRPRETPAKAAAPEPDPVTGDDTDDDAATDRAYVDEPIPFLPVDA